VKENTEKSPIFYCIKKEDLKILLIFFILLYANPISVAASNRFRSIKGSLLAFQAQRTLGCYRAFFIFQLVSANPFSAFRAGRSNAGQAMLPVKNRDNNKQELFCPDVVRKLLDTLYGCYFRQVSK